MAFTYPLGCRICGVRYDDWSDSAKTATLEILCSRCLLWAKDVLQETYALSTKSETDHQRRVVFVRTA